MFFQSHTDDLSFHPRKSLLDSSWLIRWIVALVLGVLGQIAWAVWFIPEGPVRSRQPQMVSKVIYARATYLTSEQELAQRRSLWSPTLFALPSDFGFSAAIRGEHVTIPPPLEIEFDPSVYYRRVFIEDTVSIRPIFQPSGELGGIRQGLNPYRVEDRRVDTGSRIVVSTVSDDIAVHEILHQPLPKTASWPGEKPWDVTLTATVSAMGRVKHVMIHYESITPPAVDELIAQIHRWSFKPGADDRYVEISLSYAGAMGSEMVYRKAVLP